MTPVYYLLGMFAKLCHELGRVRANGFPGHWLVLIVAPATILLIASDVELRDRQSCGKPPVSASVADVLRHGGWDNRYVRLSGLRDTPAQLASHGNSDDVYIPVVDPKSNVAVMVDFEKPPYPAVGPVHCVGMLRPIPPVLQEALSGVAFRLGKDSIDDSVYLTAGETPANPAWFGILTGVCAPVMLLAIVVLGMRNIVFQPIPAVRRRDTATPPDSSTPLDLRLSGRLVLGKVPRRFLAVPTAGAHLDDGTLTFASTVDASSTYTGIGVDSFTSAWRLIPKPGTLQRVARGYQYLGVRRRPALMFRYVPADSRTGRSETAILTCGSEEQLDRVEPAFEIAAGAAA